MIRLFTLLFTLTTTLTATAQDIHFSQFYASPLTLNPALTGVINGNIRAIGNYRNQWNSFAPFTTYAGSVDMNFGQSFLANDLIGIGVSFFADKAGDNDFGTTQANFSVSYIKRLGGTFSGRNYLSVGFQGGMAQRTINYSTLTFGNQFDGFNYNPTMSSGETLGADHFMFADLSGGITWFLVPKADKFNMYAGVAFHHVNQPDQSFLDGSQDNLLMRTTGNIGMQIPVGYSVDLVPAVMVQSQGPYKELVGGTNLKFYLNGREYTSTALSIGAWQRVGSELASSYKSDATILTTRFDWKAFSLGFSYDINVSSLKDASNGNGGPEVSLVWVGDLPHRDRKIECPKF